MAKFYNKGPVIFQEPTEKTAADGSKSVSMGFRVAICDCGDGLNDTYNAKAIVRCLNMGDDVKKLVSYLIANETLHLDEEMTELLHRILK